MDFGGGYDFRDGSYSMSDGGWGGQGRPGGRAGVLTAGEWNDLDHWGFWSGLMTSNEFQGMSNYWRFYTSRRVAVRVADAAGKRLPNVKVDLVKGQGEACWSTRTDNLGEASLWVGPFDSQADIADLAIVIDDVRQSGAPKVTPWNVQQTEAEINFYQISGAQEPEKKADVAFIVDRR